MIKFKKDVDLKAGICYYGKNKQNITKNSGLIYKNDEKRKIRRERGDENGNGCKGARLGGLCTL